MSIFTQEDLNIIIPMFSVTVFALSVIAFMLYQEKKLKDLEDKAPTDEELRERNAQKSHP